MPISKPITINNQAFPSITDARNFYHVPQGTFYKRLKRGLTPEQALLAQKDETFTSQPVTVDGVSYSSYNEACHALNVPQSTFLGRLRRGLTPQDALKKSRIRVNRKRTPLEINGHHFNSITAACDYFKIKPITYYKRIEKGMKPVQALTMPTNARGKQRMKQITVNGKVFESIAAACNHFKIKPATYYKRLEKGMSPTQALTMHP